MSALEILTGIGVAAAITVAMATVDFAHARYSMSMIEVRRLQERNLPWRRELWMASLWSVMQWCAGAVALVVVIKVSLWYLPFEAVGLVIGTQIGGSRRASSGVSTS